MREDNHIIGKVEAVTDKSYVVQLSERVVFKYGGSRYSVSRFKVDKPEIGGVNRSLGDSIDFDVGILKDLFVDIYEHVLLKK